MHPQGGRFLYLTHCSSICHLEPRNPTAQTNSTAGGQPSDKGELRCGDATLAVDQVSTDAATKKIVLHTGRLVSGAL